jgi:Bacterial Ig domain/Calx-beta domain
VRHTDEVVAAIDAERLLVYQVSDVRLDLLANDTDPDGDPLTIASFEVVTPFGSTIVRDPQDPNVLSYERGPDMFAIFDHFTYEIEDGNGGTATGLATVVVDWPLPPSPSPIEVSPARLDFGAVPLGQTATRELTITNVGSNAVGPFDFWAGRQRAPEPFETNTLSFPQCIAVLQPGDSCTHKLRFWSVAGADVASPAALQVFSYASNTELLAAVAMFAEVAPPVPAPPNSPPVAADDIWPVNGPGLHTVDPTRNDNDADNDQLQIVGAGDPPHGSVAIENCDVGLGRSTLASCIHYTPDAGFVGVDFTHYTVSDGRGGTDTGTIWLGVQSGTQFPIPRIDSVTPNHGPSGDPVFNVTITGANFTPGNVGGFVRWRCGATQETSHQFSIFSDPFRQQISALVPDLPSGPCDVEVGNGFNFTAIRANGYTVDAPLPTVLPGGGSIAEGNAGTRAMSLGVRLSAPSNQAVTVRWTTLQLSGGTNADGSNDYTPATGTVTFAPGETTKTVPVSIRGDALDEPNEHVWVSWHDPTNAVVGGLYGLGYGIIRDDDSPPKVLPGAATATEGDSGTTVIDLPVSLSAASGRTVTVDWTTLAVAGAQFATPPDDFPPGSGTVTFAPGETTKSVPVVVKGDLHDEPNEYVPVSFRNPTNAVIGGFYGLGFGVIEDDD